MLRALLYAYVLGGITFIPLLIVAAIFITVYTSVPLGDPDVSKKARGRLEADGVEDDKESKKDAGDTTTTAATAVGTTNDLPRTRKGWLTMRRTFEESAGDGSYVTLVRSFLDSRSKDPKRSRPKDMWYVVLKGTVLYLYEDEEMSECEAAIELSGHKVVIYPEDIPDAELFAKRNAICLKPKNPNPESMPSVTRKMHTKQQNVDEVVETSSLKGKRRESLKQALVEEEKKNDAAREQATDPTTPWFIFVRSNVEMEDWYFALIHGSEQPSQTPTLDPLRAIFDPADMDHLVSTLDAQPDVIPMRWLNALLGRIFFSHYRTQNLESYIIGRLMKKLSKVKRPAFLTEIEVTEVSVGNKAPMLSKPMLKELTKEGDASLEVHLQYKGEIRITVEATAVINLGARFKSYTVKLTLAAVLKELEGNLLIKVKRPPSNRIWYAFTQTPRMVLEVEPIVSDRQITWGMILSTIESKFKEIIQESVVMPNMDDIAFFDTERYEHRGGIWSDTCRKPRVPSAPAPEEEETQSSVSAPPLDAPTSSSDSVTSISTQKADDNASIQSAPPATTAPPEGSSSSPSNPDEAGGDASRNSTRRRTWFSSVRSEEMATASAPNFFAEPDQPGKLEEERGRTLDLEPSAVQERSKSTPNNRDVGSITPELIEKEEKQDQDQAGLSQLGTPASLLTSTSSRRSVSQHSIKVQQQQDEEDEDPINSQTKSTPTTPRKNSDASQVGRAPSPPSFFSTLKSKAAAADKQAISNTAKEAIRKWGVNWGGFKRDSNNASQSSDDNSGSSPPRSDDSSFLKSDGPGSSSPSSSINGKPMMHKPRASYAEVRAKVAERKQRERMPYLPDDGSEISGQLSPPPETTNSFRSRVQSTPTAPNGYGLSLSSETPINPSIISSTAPLSTPSRVLASKKSSPSMGRINTEMDAQLQHQQPATPANPHTAATGPNPPQEPVKPAPIHMQPVAKTMSIPGIHASHRGEVQSMGYIAPAQQPAPPAPSGGNGGSGNASGGSSVAGTGTGPMTETMLKNPAIQTVYRFLKPNSAAPAAASPIAGTLQAEDAQGNAQGQGKQEDKPSSTGNASGAPSLLSRSQPPSVKPTPPPLPPRSTPSAITRPTSRDSTGSSAQGSSPPSSASEALKNIAQKDARSRPRSTSSMSESELGPTPFSGDDDNATPTPTPTAALDISELVSNTEGSEPRSTDLPPVLSKSPPPPLPPRRTPTPA